MFDLGLRSITVAGVLLVVYLSLAIIVFLAISGPVDSIFDGFDDADAAEATDEMNLYLPNIRTAMHIAFTLFIVTPVVGFVMWVFSREPFYEHYRRF